MRGRQIHYGVVMYTHCLFCRADLGRNAVIEHFPIGRRLAFDAAKGRLWVVCPACAQWNLTPLEERWEAVEECERQFRGTRRRIQGDQVGLARLPEGLELVRIGRPQRPEFAAWRYGDQFGRRRRQALVHVGVGVGAVATAVAAGPLIGIGIGAGLTILSTAANIAAVAHAANRNLKLPHPDGGEMLITNNQRPFVRLIPRREEEGGWGLEIPYQSVLKPGDPWWKRDLGLNLPAEGVARLSGPAAVAAADKLLTNLNARGAKPRLVQDAVGLIEESGGPDRWFAAAAARTREWGAQQNWGDTGAINHLPRPVKLALEMAAHEAQERRALEGELAALEARWREAEEVAAIADDMLLPASLGRMIARIRERTRG